MDRTNPPQRMRLAVALAIAAAWLIAVAPGHADEHEAADYEKARQAVADGRALPLARILDMVSPLLHGQLLGVELEAENTVLIYELKVLAPNGRLSEVRVDAATGTIIDNDGGREPDADLDR